MWLFRREPSNGGDRQVSSCRLLSPQKCVRRQPKQEGWQSQMGWELEHRGSQNSGGCSLLRCVRPSSAAIRHTGYFTSMWANYTTLNYKCSSSQPHYPSFKCSAAMRDQQLPYWTAKERVFPSLRKVLLDQTVLDYFLFPTRTKIFILGITERQCKLL